MNMLRIAGTVGESIVDGPGMRYVIFTQGCPHHCEGCHNPDTHAFDAGTLMDIDTLYNDIMKNPMISGVTFSGGEPFCQPEPLTILAKKLKEQNKHIMIYTGYTFEELMEKDEFCVELLKQCDLLVDGRFILAQKDLSLQFRGSRNQRILKVQELRVALKTRM